MHTQFNISSIKGGNTGSCANLTNYLDKEQENEWFNQENKSIQTDMVKSEIDRYGKGQLGKDDWKFVEVEYNPSKREQQQIIYRATGKENVRDLNELTTEDKLKVKNEFKDYVIEAQNIQAQNFNRDNIKNGSDLKYYGKVETQRRYKGTDQEVIQGKAQQGDLKKGLNMHCHVVQSRKAKDKKTKLSPVSKHKKQSSKNRIQQGFNRNEFYNKIEKEFDRRFGYDRDLKQTFEWKKANKYNRVEDLKRLEGKSEPTHTHAQQRKDYLLEFRENQKLNNQDLQRKIEQNKERANGYSR